MSLKLLDYKLKFKDNFLNSIIYCFKFKGKQYFRVLKIIRLLRNPREISQIETLLEMHRDVVSAFKENSSSRLILIAVFSKRLGLMWCYGVAVADGDLNIAESWAEKLFEALKACLKGTYRQLIFRSLTRREACEMIRILMKSNRAAAIIGLPEPREAMAKPSKTLYYHLGTRIVEMVEEVVRGLISIGEEFAYTVLAQSIDPKTLHKLLIKVSKLCSKYSGFDETASLGFHLTLPFSYNRSIIFGSQKSHGETSTNQRIKSHIYSSNKSMGESLSESRVESRSESKGRVESRISTESRIQTFSTGTSQIQSHSKSLSHESFRSNSKYTSISVGEASSESKSKTETIGESLIDYDKAVNELGYRVETVSKGFTKSRAESSSRSENWSISGEFNVGGKPFGIGVSGGSSHSRGGSITEGSVNTKAESSSNSIQIPIGKIPTFTENHSESTVHSHSKSKVNSHGESWSMGESIGEGESYTTGYSTFKSQSLSIGESVSRGFSTSRSFIKGESKGTVKSFSRSIGVNRSSGISIGEGFSKSEIKGLSLNAGNIYSLGVYPGISLNYSVRRIDEVKRIAYELLRFERDRIAQMISQGGYHVLCSILGSEKIVTAAKALIIQAYTPTKIYPEPLRVVEGDEEFLLSVKTLSFDLRASNHLLRPYMYMNIYNATELAALTHPPRVEAPGIETVMENIPEFRVPSPRSYDVEFGNVVSHELGELTDIRFGIDGEELLHAGFFGITRSGKTNAAMIFLSRCIINLNANTLILDWKKDWRRLLEKVKGKLYILHPSKYTGKIKPLTWNPLIPPRNVDPETWRDTVVTWFCMTYGLGARSYTLLWEILDELYAERGIYDGYLNNPPTLKDVYRKIKSLYAAERNSRRITFEQLDLYVKTLARLKYYTRGRLSKLFSNRKHIDVSMLLKGVNVIEAGEMADIHKPFLLGLLALSAFYHRKFSGPTLNPEIIVLEEAHQVVFDPTVKDIARQLNITESIFDKMAAESAGYNQYLTFIAQHPSTLSNGVLKNLGLIIIFKLIAENNTHRDIQIVKDMICRGTERAYIEVARFISRLPVGWSIIRKCRSLQLIEQEPVIVKWDIFK
ncbi:MAG: DUF87 domain-containing protein [archaeon GB-1845-036]|nr:DUF87 domain-containing protein [Candidatus Culexmicrobium thermophilum]